MRDGFFCIGSQVKEYIASFVEMNYEDKKNADEKADVAIYFFLSLVVILFGMVLGMVQNVLAADGNYLTFTGGTVHLRCLQD